MRIPLLLVMLGLVVLRAAEAPAVPPVVAWDLPRLEAVRERLRQGDAQLAPALERLRRDGEGALPGPDATVTDKAADAPAPSGDPHDFVSCSTYHWPDPADPQAPWVWKDGQFNAAMIEKYDLPRLKRMTTRVTDGALAWWFTGDRRYADAAVRQVRTWFVAPATRMTPHLDYAQIIPNQDGSRGHPYGIIDARTFVPLLSALALLERDGLIPPEDRTALRDWFRAYLDWLTTSRLGQAEAKATNNHGIYYDLQAYACAAYLGERAQMREILDRFQHQRIAKQIETDGRMPRELARADGATYSTFALSGLVQMVVMAHQGGTDLWRWTSEDGRSLRTAATWYLPFLAGTAWTGSGTFTAAKLTEAFVMAASLTGDAELTVQARRLATDPAARRNLLFPLPATQP